MADDQSPSEAPDPRELVKDPDALKQSHDRTGKYLKQAGLPFEEEEFDEQDSDRASQNPPADEEE